MLRHGNDNSLVLDQHVHGAAVDGVRHMCPAERCGNPANPFCPVCLGAGSITTDRLDRWQATVLREAGEI
ncbi:hypothetical protein Prum_061130 [Phytohabitans rumicis]|uniref:Uncharacterized protein n=2 Tax=Phytohabitans rumicis TaxID=1076125 RepID=A0A6V8LCH1_9ACTN|nr:hypothetical protein Prum_061130 [Phytohabitans rumicis]